MIDFFVSITIYSTSAILLCPVYSFFNIVLTPLFCALLSEAIQFFSQGFLFLAMSMFSPERFRLLSLEMSIQLFFFPFFVLWLFLFWWCFALSVLFLVVVISLRPRFFMLSSSRCIDASMLSWMLTSPLHPSFFLTHTVSLHHISKVRPYASSWVFLFSSPLVEVLLLSISRMVPSILREDSPVVYPFN